MIPAAIAADVFNNTKSAPLRASNGRASNGRMAGERPASSR